ncbi:MAG: DUF433 domain-containing protein [Trueperaceae bacterium]|nr:DUF433 domain-containing protein [Trueperaceae bacterium]
MTVDLSPENVPLTQTEQGVLLVSGTRVGLEVIVSDFNLGASAEEIALSYSSLSLADVYAVIAFYLRHKEELTAYLNVQAEQAEASRACYELEKDLSLQNCL